MSTAFDNSWQALLQPGKTTRYFNITYPPIELEAPGFSVTNALWLAELSRLIYRRDSEETAKPVQAPRRTELLFTVALTETQFFSQGATQCALLETSKPECAVLVFRGSHELDNWFTNFNTWAVAWPEGGRVHQGFKKSFDQVWDSVERCLRPLKKPIFYTGHSLGAALATLAAAKRPPLALYTFGSPRVGNTAFASLFQTIRAYRVVNYRDWVTRLPFEFIRFGHVGELHYITHEGRLLAQPSPQMIAADHCARQRHHYPHRLWFEPPTALAAHSPVNYVAHLENVLFS